MVLEPGFVLRTEIPDYVGRHRCQGNIAGIIYAGGGVFEPRRLVSGAGYNMGRHDY
jgi:hypothetical protein